MFEVRQPRSARRSLALVVSFFAHAAIIFIAVHREPIFVKPSSTAWGRHGADEALVYIAPRLESASKQHPKLELNRRNKKQPKPVPPPPVESARAGTPNGSLFHGPASGVEATPAIPLAFPDPEIYPWQLSGVQGDVIVEVTIDEKGVVSDTRVLQSLKREIDDKCIATLKNWRFRPAMLDGVAIASRQDVHFHFPS